VITVADRHRIAAYHNKHCQRAFRWYRHRWPSTTMSHKNRGSKWIFRDFTLPHTFQEWTGPKSLETDQDNLCAKFSALKQCKFRPARFKASSARVQVTFTGDTMLLISMPGPDLAGGRPGAQPNYGSIVVFVVWKYSDCFDVLILY